MLTYAAEINRSTVVMTACDEQLQQFFSALGKVTVLEKESWFELATVSMCMNGWFYHLADELQKWLTDRGLPQNDARALVTGAMRDCAEYAQHHEHLPLDTMLRSIATEGTYTAQGLAMLQQQEAIGPWLVTADAVTAALNSAGSASER